MSGEVVSLCAVSWHMAQDLSARGSPCGAAGSAGNGTLDAVSRVRLLASELFSSSHTSRGAVPFLYTPAAVCSCFSLMLLTFELRVARWEQTLRRLFGFMYSDYGRACFLLL